VGIQNFSENVLLITLPEQPQKGDEFEKVGKILSEEVDRDAVVDFSKVQMLTSGTLCALIILDRLLKGYGRLLVLCNVSPEIKHIFSLTGLVVVFEFAEDELAALQRIRIACRVPVY
jgi:anti-anti-sigma regulatory factor